MNGRLPSFAHDSADKAALHRIDAALAELGAVDSWLTAARRGQWTGVGRDDVARRFRAVAQASAGHDALAPVQELAALVERVTGEADRRFLHTAGETEVVQQAVDVLSMLLRDRGHQLLGRRGADVTPAATALRERLESLLMAARG
jgi:hypothetical protein